MPNVDVDKAHPAVRIRIPREDEIVFSLVGPREEIGFTIPALLRGFSIRLARELPKSGIQLHGPQWYQHFHLERNLGQPVRFGVVFEENMARSLNHVFEAPALIHVIFWKSKAPDAIKALCQITAPKVVVVEESAIKADLLASGFHAELIAQDFDDIFLAIQNEAKKMPHPEGFSFGERTAINRKIADDWRDAVLPSPQDRFQPLTTNRCQIRQMLGEYRDEFWKLERVDQLNLRPAAQATAFEAVIRLALAMIDPIHTEGKWRVSMPPVIFAFPSVSPLWVDRLKSIASRFTEGKIIIKNYVSMLLAEQNSETFESKSAVDGNEEKEILPALQAASLEFGAYSRFFDDLGYLHGSFKASPYMRAPLKGKSLAQHHSYFSPKNFSTNARERATLRKIRAFSSALTEAIDPRMRDALFAYPETIVGLSDLPVEWLDNGGVPLCFSHNVCRIPETTPTNMLSQFGRNQRSSFVIDGTLLENTLIVCGAPDGDKLQIAFKAFSEVWADRKVAFKWAHCMSLEELYRVVNERRPQLLIFDTHGRFTGNEMGTELQFGSEYLDGVNVIKHLPQVPLVILSSCWGAPLYGCANTIAHAFFETGSFAVTCSLLPLNIFKATNLYTRVLTNLENATTRGLHDTWASFMSHNVRTSYFDDLKVRMLRQYPESMADSDVYVAQRIKWQLATTRFDERQKAFLGAKEAVVRCLKPEFADRARQALEDEEYVPDFMFYSTMGRADLVQFESWNREFARPRDQEPTFADVLAGIESKSAGEAGQSH